MDVKLTQEEKAALEAEHRHERDRRVADRIKAVLLRSEGWEFHAIAQALRLHEETIRSHIEDYLGRKKLKPENGGSNSKLNLEQSQALDLHLQFHTYTAVWQICNYVFQTLGITYTIPGMLSWLHEHEFSFKKPKGIPAKADPEKQKAFLKTYEDLKKSLSPDEVILFTDGVHPTQATKITYGWIKKGEDKVIATTASRTRLNILGALNLDGIRVSYTEHETINTEAVIAFFKQLELEYEAAPRIHVILDQAGYHTSEALSEHLKGSRIQLHFLPAYSPNLNAIERLWKVMNETVRNNRHFSSAREFRETIRGFFRELLPKMAQSLTSRLNDNFYVLNPVPSG